MTLVVEDGTGVPGADSYAALAGADAYFAARAHLALAATWDAATDANKEGALREASAYLDATYGPHYRGTRRGYVQGLEWPRSGARDDADYPLPALPEVLVRATCELAAGAAVRPDVPKSSPSVFDRARGRRKEAEGATSA